MKSRISPVLVLALLSSLLTVAALPAQPKPQGNGLYRIEGTVISMDEGKSTITLRQRSGSNMAWTVRYTGSTSFSYRNTVSSVEDVKVGRRVICLGRFGEGGAKNEMTAVIVDVRSGK